MIKEISHFIASKTSFVIGTTLQVAHRTQDSPDRCNVVLETAGGAVYFDLPDRVDKNIQIISRAKTYMEASADAQEIFKALHGTAGWTLPMLSDSISPCDADTDWTGTDLSIDTADKKEGAGSLKDNVASPVASGWYDTTYDPAGTWDWSAKKYLLFWLKSDRANTAFTVSRLQVFDTLGNWRLWHLTFSAGEWTAVKKLLSTGYSQSATPPNLALISHIWVRFQAADTTAFYKKIDDLRIVEEEYEAMVIEALADPQYIGQDEKGRFEFSTNYIFRIQNL